MANKSNNSNDLIVSGFNSTNMTNTGFDEFAGDEGIDLLQYWLAIYRYRWAILALVFAVGLFTTIYAYSLQPLYRSTATLLIGGDEAVTKSDSQSWANSGDYLKTQDQLIWSRKVAKRVLETQREVIVAHLETDSDFGFDWRDWVPQSLLGLAEPDQPPIAESDPDKELYDWLWNGLGVRNVFDTSIIQVSFDTTEPELAARIANAYTRAYLDYNLQQRVESTTEASQWLEEQMVKSEQRVSKSADTLRQYQDEMGLVDVEGMHRVKTQLLKERSASLSMARLARSEAESLYRRAERLYREGRLDNIPEVLANVRIQRLREEEELLLRKIRSDSERYQDDYPGLEDPRSELRALREHINESLKKIVEGFKADFDVARSNEQLLDREVKALQDEIQELGRKQVEVDTLERMVETNRQAYDAFLDQLMATRTRSADTVSLIAQVIDPAVPVSIPVAPNKRRMLITSLILALMGGVGVALIVLKLDNTLKSRDDVQERLGVPLLGELIKLNGTGADGMPLTSHAHFTGKPTSSFAESVRTIRTGVVLSSLDHSNQTLVITSSLNGEGKSTVALNLSLALAQLGKVLLIDADLRNPTQASSLGMDSKIPGLTDLVAGTFTMAECIHKIPGDLDVLFAGSTTPPDPPKILTSEHFSKMLAEAEATYDTVVIDSAPLELVSDARILATKATGVVYVIKAGETPHQVVREGLNALTDTGTPLLGVILNQCNPDKVQAYGNFKYGYSRNGRRPGAKSTDSIINIRKLG